LTETAAKTCSLCNDTGWKIVVKDGREFAQRCQCQAENAIKTRSQRANLPQRFLLYELDSFCPHKNFPSQKKIIKRVRKFIDDYPAVLDAKGLLFQGRAGVGKTRLLCAIATELFKRPECYDIYYIDWNDLLREMRSGSHHMTKDFSELNKFIEKLAAVDLLLFDELGASKLGDLSQWMMDTIYYIFNKRYNNQKVTICAANFFDNPKDGSESLTERIGERIRSRLFEMTDLLVLEGSDRRREM
jgi:DNA replication protein DnaC